MDMVIRQRLHPLDRVRHLNEEQAANAARANQEEEDLTRKEWTFTPVRVETCPHPDCWHVEIRDEEKIVLGWLDW
jgi:hypothetical protein